MASRKDTARARRLRRDMTDAEKVMWRLLRARQLAGHKFRRQQSLGRYILDFVCFSHRLVIEVDGGQHALPDHINADEVRTAYLERGGFLVLRFWNNDLIQNPEGVYARILETLAARPPHLPGAARRAPPSPTEGRGTLT